MLQSEKKYKNAFHELAIGGEGGQLSAALLIENEIERYETDWRSNRSSAILKFCPDVERRFEIDTCGPRARELQLARALGFGFFFATTITDFVFVPYFRLLGPLERCALVPLVLM